MSIARHRMLELELELVAVLREVSEVSGEDLRCVDAVRAIV
jgi:hypothetical protein